MPTTTPWSETSPSVTYVLGLFCYLCPRPCPHQGHQDDAPWIRELSGLCPRDAVEVFARFRGYAHDLAVVDKWRDLRLEAGLERRFLELACCGGVLDAGRGVGDLEINGRRQFDAQDVAVVEQGGDGLVGLDELQGVAEYVVWDGGLLVALIVHEHGAARVGVEVLQLPAIQVDLLNVLAGAEAFFDVRGGAKVFQLDLGVRRPLTGLDVLKVGHEVDFAVLQNRHSMSNIL